MRRESERFETLDELRTAVRRFGRACNQHWLIERHGYRTPTEAREHLRAQKAGRRLPTDDSGDEIALLGGVDML